MRQLGITTALTTDRHFEQAGFIRLLTRSLQQIRCVLP
jgi:predicted nucleic acid-binding protein